jgi:hypothetical protein
MESALVVLVVGLLSGVEWLLLRGARGMGDDHLGHPHSGRYDEHREDGLGGDGMEGGSGDSTLLDLSDTG